MYDATGVNATSTSVSLLYANRPQMNFAAYVAKIEEGLRGCFEERLQLTWDHDDIVMIDIDGARVLMGFWEALDAEESSCAAVLVLSVGPGPDWQTDSRLARFRKTLCQSVTARIMERTPADMVLWKDFQGVFTPEDFDNLIEDALAVGARPEPDDAPTIAAPDSATMAEDAKGPELAAKGPRFGAMPVQQLMDRLEGKIHGNRQRQDAGDGAKSPLDVANDMPDLPAPDLSQVERIRQALYPPEQDEAQAPLARRLTIYTANTTLLLVALPVGAALLTYNILGGEDAKVTARAMALTGAAIGLSQSVLGHYIMALVS